MNTINIVSTLPVHNDPLSYFASTQDKIQQHEPKQPQHINHSWENDNPAYYDSAYDYNADKLQKHRMEDDIAKLKLQLAEEKAEQDRLHLFTRCLEKECSVLRQDLQNAMSDQRADTGVRDAKGVKSTIQRFVIRVLEEQYMIKNDISVLTKEIHTLKQKLQFFGVDQADTSKETLATDDHDRLPKTCRRHTLPKEVGMYRLSKIFSFRRCSTVSWTSFLMDGRGQQEDCQGSRKTENGDLVVESLLWD
uniref:Uncharacterized protein n=1 Tax=Ditylum brightwellii TaxID=49249 RepID=A0A7S4VCW8_9STRA